MVRGKDARFMKVAFFSQDRFFLQQRYLLLGLILLLIAISIPYGLKAAEGKSAVVRWFDAIDKFEDGKNIWKEDIHPNSPMMLLLLRPLAELPPVIGALTWYYLKVVMVLLAIYAVFRLVEDPGQPYPLWAKVVTVLLSLRPIQGDLMHGNINLFILFLVVAALFAFHHGRDWTAGVVLGLAIVCKVAPALFVPYFLWKRAWKTLAGCALGLVLFFGIVPACILGPAKNAEALGSWVNKMIEPYVLESKVFYSEYYNQSLPGLIVRLATHSPSTSRYDDQGRYEPLEYSNLLNLDPSVVGWLLKGCLLGFGALIVWSCRTPITPRHGWRLSAEYSLILLGMLLLNERTWKHHCVTLLVPFAVLAYYVATCRLESALRAYLLGTLAASFLLMTSTSTGLNEVDKLTQLYGAYVGVYFMLGTALTILLRRSDPLRTGQVDQHLPAISAAA